MMSISIFIVLKFVSYQLNQVNSLCNILLIVRLSVSAGVHSLSHLHMHQFQDSPPNVSANSHQMKGHEDQYAQKTSATRIAAAFRPIQPDTIHITQTVNADEQSKNVVEIWPKTKSLDVRGIGDSKCSSRQTRSPEEVPKWHWPTSVIFNQHTTSSNKGQPKDKSEITPGLLPFKPIPTVQRIPTPPPGQTIWNRSDHERVTQSPSLRGIYRPPSPMLANPIGDWQYMANQDIDNGVRKGAELLITNLDNKMSRKDLKHHLLAKLSDHCKVTVTHNIKQISVLKICPNDFYMFSLDNCIMQLCQGAFHALQKKTLVPLLGF